MIAFPAGARGARSEEHLRKEGGVPQHALGAMPKSIALRQMGEPLLPADLPRSSSAPIVGHVLREEREKRKSLRVNITYGAFCFFGGWLAYLFCALNSHDRIKEMDLAELQGLPDQFWWSTRCIMGSAVVLLFAVTWGCCQGDYSITAKVARIEGGESLERKWSRIGGVVFNLTIFLAVIALVPIVQAVNPGSPQSFGPLVAGIFTVLAVLLGLREIVKHWLNYHSPRLQKHVVRILFMVPLYALDSFAILVSCAKQLDTTQFSSRCDTVPGSGSTATGFLGGDYPGMQNHPVADESQCFDRNNRTKPLVCNRCDENNSCYEEEAVLVLTIVRDLYEAYTLYSFFMYCTVQLIEV
eukprot:COSAG05_NODE_5132_length_1256_cov_1.726016_1_plen_354_part_10